MKCSLGKGRNVNTMQSTGRAIQILRSLGENPATSFYERLVSIRIESILTTMAIPFILDDYGNVIAKVTGTDSLESPIAFVAHMDHPGFEVIEDGDGTVVAGALGGVPVAALRKNVNAFSFDSSGTRASCRLEPLPELGKRRVYVRSEAPLGIGTPIVFDLPDMIVENGTIKMRALDDLGGCAAILASLESISADPPESDVYGVFTRAEEVGLIGARLLSGEKTLPENTFVVSVETSSLIPGVIQGGGPIIRTGDASYTFNAEAEQILIMGRENILKEDSEFRCQRQLMSAGSCEASAFAVNGYRTTGIAFALGNWHNATTSIMDEKGDVGEEYISLQDLGGGVQLIESAARSVSVRHDSRLSSRANGEVNEEYRNRLLRKS
jgi:endoglucanase